MIVLFRLGGNIHDRLVSRQLKQGQCQRVTVGSKLEYQLEAWGDRVSSLF